jgi:hypothetical protein
VIRHSCAQRSRVATGGEGAGGRNRCDMHWGRNRIHPEDGKGRGRTRPLELDPSRGFRRTHDTSDHGLQPLQKWEGQLRYVVSTATLALHRRRKDITCPRTLFRQHLTAAITKWRAPGERIVLFMDHNEHAYDGMLGRALSNREGLNLREVILDTTGVRTGATYFQGSHPIDGLWASADLDISNACVMPFGYGVGDHRAFISEYAQYG